MMVRMEKDVLDCKRRVKYENELEWLAAGLYDLRKAYPPVNKPALWWLPERFDMKRKGMQTLIVLHECTKYKVVTWLLLPSF